MKSLDQQGVVDYIVDEDIRDIFFKHFNVVLKEYFQKMVMELEKQMNSKTSNILEELNMRIKHIGSALMYTNATIVKLVQGDVEFNENHVEEAAIGFAEIFLDYVTFTSAKKSGVSMEKNVLKQKGVKGEQ